MTRERGHWLERSDGRTVLVTLHPSALLRMEPEDKAAAYAAWLADLRTGGRGTSHRPTPDVAEVRQAAAAPLPDWGCHRPRL